MTDSRRFSRLNVWDARSKDLRTASPQPLLPLSVDILLEQHVCKVEVLAVMVLLAFKNFRYSAACI
jgi:hypothetical protein